ncbi:hypothetical protein, partial [uncultured Psychrosphaera sp.]|uniref:hypothetical protein n=1 Tax=uncultured Psychrosphaera sp. TaxID=1403522 RepID=UPI0030F50E27
MNKKINITLSGLFITVLSACGSNNTSEQQIEVTPEQVTAQKQIPDVPVQDKIQVNENWNLVWQDEFE